MERTSHFHHQIGKPFLGVAKHLFDDPSALGSADTMLYYNPKTGENSVKKARSYAQIFALGLLLRLVDTHSFGRVALKTSVLKEEGGNGITDLLGIGHLLVMNRPGGGRTQIDNPSPKRLGNQEVFVDVGFFFPL